MGCAISTSTSSIASWVAGSSLSQTYEKDLGHILTMHQMRIIRDTWDVVGEDMDRTGLIIFRRLVT